MKRRRETPITLHFYCKQEKKEITWYVERKKLSITKYVLVLNQQNKPILFYMKTREKYLHLCENDN